MDQIEDAFLVDELPGGVRAWAAFRTQFETDQDARQRAFMDVLDAVMPAEGGPVLHAVATTPLGRGTEPDAENLTLYNFRRALKGLRGLTAVSFERSYATAPDGWVAEHTWQREDDVPAWTHWRPGATLATWEDVPVATVFGETAGRNVWLAVRRALDRVTVRQAGHPGRYAVRTVITVPPGTSRSVLDAVKGVIDGPIAALQVFPDEAAAERVLTKHARWPHWQPATTLAELVQLATAPGATAFAGPPFNGNGLDPADDRCVAGTVELREGDAFRLSGELVAVAAAA